MDFLRTKPMGFCGTLETLERPGLWQRATDEFQVVRGPGGEGGRQIDGLEDVGGQAFSYSRVTVFFKTVFFNPWEGGDWS